MKQSIFLALTVVLAGGIGNPGSADAVGRPLFDNSSSACCGPRAGGRPGQFLEKWASLLKLSDAQKTQFAALAQENRQATASLRDQEAAARRQLRSVMAPATFDEAAARSVLTQLAATRTELTIAHAKLRSRIFALLTPEQQATAQNIRDFLEPPGIPDGPAPGHHGGPPRW